MSYSNGSIESVPISILNSEVSVALGSVGIASAMTETGEDLRMAYVSGQVTISGGVAFWLRQNGIWTAENIDNNETISLYLAKLAGIVPEYLKLERWEGNVDPAIPALVDPLITKIDITALLDEESFSLTGHSQVSIATESGEGFAYALNESGAVDGAVGGNYGVIHHGGIWEIKGLDLLNSDIIYLAKREGSSPDEFKIETFDA